MNAPAHDPRRDVVAWLSSDHIAAEIKRALPDHVPVEWFLRVAQTAILNNPDLSKADKGSLLRELVAVAQLGLVVDPALGEAWLIIDGHKKVQRRIGYQGLRKLALQSGQVTGLNAQAVYSKDRCKIALGDNPRVEHEIDTSLGDRGEVIGCYAVGKVTGTNEPVIEWMSWQQIDAHRRRYSDAYKRNKSGPWGDPLGEVEMGRKTVFRRLAKWLPKSPLLVDALANEDRAEMMRDVTPANAALPAPADESDDELDRLAARSRSARQEAPSNGHTDPEPQAAESDQEAATEPDDEYDNSEPEPIAWVGQDTSGDPLFYLRGRDKPFSYLGPFARALSEKIAAFADPAEVEAAERDIAGLPEGVREAMKKFSAADVQATG